MKKIYQDKNVIIHLDLESNRLIFYEIAAEKIHYQEFWYTQFEIEIGDFEYVFAIANDSNTGELVCGNCYCKNTKTGTEIKKMWYGSDL